MSLNNMGMGFGLSLKDDGFDKGIKGAQKSASAFGSTMDGLKMVGAGIGATLKWAFKMPSVGPALGQIQNMANDYKITTTSVEAFGVAADKVSSATLAGLNLNAKESAKWKSTIASTAYSMNMDVGSVATSFKALEQAGVDVTKIGFKSFGEYQKFLSVTGTDSKQFATTIGKMRSQFKMSDAQIKDTLTTVVALGKRFNMGSEAAQGMANTVGVLSEEGASLWAELGPEKTKAFLQGTQALSIAFMKAGHSAQEAQDLALGVGRAMIKGESGVQQLYSGLQDDLPEAMQVLTENLGSAGAAFNVLQKDPAKFTATMAMAAKKIRDNAKSPEEAQQQLARFSNQMSQSFGPQFSALIGGSLDSTIASFKAVDAELNKPGGLADKNGVIGKISSNYRDGLTMTERLGRAQDLFKTKLKGLMHETDGEFLKRFNVSADITSKKLTQLAAQGGPLGKTVSLFEEFAMHGLGGVASKISKDYGPAMAVLIQQFGPILSQLPAIVSAFGMLLNPITLVAAAVGGLYLYFKEAGEGGGKFKSFIDGIIPKIVDFAKKVLSTAKEVLPEIGRAIIDVFHKIDWDEVGAYLVEMGKVAWHWFIEGLKLAADLVVWLVDAIKRIDWVKVGGFLYDGIKQVVLIAGKALWYIIKNLPEIAMDIIKAIDQMLTKFLSDIWSTMKELGHAIKDWAKGLWDDLTSGVNVEKLKKVMDDYNKELRDNAQEAISDFVGVAKTNMLKVKQMAKDMSQDAIGGIKDVWSTGVEQATKGGKTTMDAAIDMAKKGLGILNKIANKSKSDAASDAALSGAAKELGIGIGDATEVIKAVAGMNPSEVKRSLDIIKGSYLGFLKDSAKQSKVLLDDSRKYFNQFITDQQSVWSDKMAMVIGNFTDVARNLLTNFWTDAINQALVKGKELVNALSGAFSGLNSGVSVNGTMDMSGGNMMMTPRATPTPLSSNPLDNLVSTINYPAWVHDVKKQLDDDASRIVKAVDLLTEVTAKKITPEQQRAMRSLETSGDNSNG